jgi:hypothetical protein
MRKLRKSENYSNREWVNLLRRSETNTSTKPYARFLHSLADTASPVKPGLPRQFVFVTRRPNRAQRREALLSIDKRISVTASPLVEVAPERKITGAVRRGLQRGKTA